MEHTELERLIDSLSLATGLRLLSQRNWLLRVVDYVPLRLWRARYTKHLGFCALLRSTVVVCLDGYDAWSVYPWARSLPSEEQDGEFTANPFEVMLHKPGCEGIIADESLIALPFFDWLILVATTKE